MDARQDLFGQIAIRRGFVTPEQLDAALATQNHRPVGTPRLLGLIMLDEGFITTGQMIEILREVRSLTTMRWMRRNAKAS